MLEPETLRLIALKATGMDWASKVPSCIAAADVWSIPFSLATMAQTSRGSDGGAASHAAKSSALGNMAKRDMWVAGGAASAAEFFPWSRISS